MPENQEKTGVVVKKDQKVARKDAKPSFFAKVGPWAKRVFVDSFKNMWAELKKVTWPSRKDLITYSIVVISFMVLMAVVIGVLDLGVSSIIQNLL